MAERGVFRPPKQWTLTETENISSYAKWQTNILFHLSLNNAFAPYLDTEWQKKSVANHGFQDDIEPVPQNDRKTAVQKSIALDQMLGLIAQFVPSLLTSEITKKATSLSWIWKRVRRYFSFEQSEVHFLKLYTIQKLDDERYETFFQRIMAHLEDNLLTVAAGLEHDGEARDADEDMSPTTERLAVYLWLYLIDHRLPSYISRVYAHDLQSKTLKDVQPQIAQNMDCLLQEINAQEEVRIQYSRSSYQPWNTKKPIPQSKQSMPKPNDKRSTVRKSCILCKSAGRQHLGHDISSCWFISKVDKLDISKAFRVNTNCVDHEPDDEQEASVEDLETEVEVCTNTNDRLDMTIQRIQCDKSPFFYAFHESTPCHVVVDTGATSSLISKTFLKLAGILPKPTNHSARGVDQSPVGLHGEVHIVISFDGMELPVDGLVVDRLDCDVLGGVPFCKTNDVEVHLRQEEISVHNKRYSYGTKKQIQHDIYRVQSMVLRNGSSQVIMPGDFVEVNNESLQQYDGEVAIEPRMDSPNGGQWPTPSISRVVHGRIRIPNITSNPIQLKKGQHFAQIRRVTLPVPSSAPPKEVTTRKTMQLQTKPDSLQNTALITIDPDNLLNVSQKKRFDKVNRDYHNVFNSNIDVYNDHSGVIRSKVCMSNVMPPPNKGRLPFYNTSNLQLLQEEADKLEAMEVLAKPEDVGVDVLYSSPSFLIKKPSGQHRFITTFNNLCQYTRVPPTKTTSCNDILQKLSSWKFMVKTDLTKSYYQIPVTKTSMQFRGTITPFKGLRVYVRAANGQPGAAEALDELMSRIFGDYTSKGFLIIIADDMYICGNTVEEVLINWIRVLKRMEENNLRLSATKTIICPKRTTVLGWIWDSGTLAVSQHKVAPLASIEPPSTCTKMRSFLGAYKALSRCIPRYSSVTSPLENCIKGMQGPDRIVWSDELHQTFKNVQDSLKSTKVLTIPRPSDKLVLTVDASPINDGLGATLFVIRKGQRLLAECFSFKLKSHQTTWNPCELEALVIGTAVSHFAPYIRESETPLQVLSDSKPCVQAYQKLAADLRDDKTFALL